MISLEKKQALKRVIAKIARPFINNKKLSVILNYHSVHPTHIFATKPDDFREQMEYIGSNFKVVSLYELYEMRISNSDLPDKLAVITFDDGYEDNYEYAFPILKRLGLPATIFLVTGFINGEIDIAKRDRTYSGLSPLKWQQILEMREEGITFGSHTHTHPILTDILLKDAENDIVYSKKILENKLNEPIKMFAYPLGQRKTFSSSVIEILKKHNFELACSTLWGCDNSCTDIFSLHRIRIDACDTMNDFKEKVNGDWDFIRWAQRLKV